MLTKCKYVNPGGIEDDGVYGNGPPQITKQDLDLVFEKLVGFEQEPFADGLYHGLMHPRMWRHLISDSTFRRCVTGGFYKDYPPNTPLDEVLRDFSPDILRYCQRNIESEDCYVVNCGYSFQGFRLWVLPPDSQLSGIGNLTENVPLTYTQPSDPSKHSPGWGMRGAFLGLFYGVEAVGEYSEDGPVIDTSNVVYARTYAD